MYECIELDATERMPTDSRNASRARFLAGLLFRFTFSNVGRRSERKGPSSPIRSDCPTDWVENVWLTMSPALRRLCSRLFRLFLSRRSPVSSFLFVRVLAPLVVHLFFFFSFLSSCSLPLPRLHSLLFCCRFRGEENLIDLLCSRFFISPLRASVQLKGKFWS